MTDQHHPQHRYDAVAAPDDTELAATAAAFRSYAATVDAALAAQSPGWVELQLRLLGVHTRIVVAGDWHGMHGQQRGYPDARHIIAATPRLLPPGEPRLILQLGDFGLWPGRTGRDYLRAVSTALQAADTDLWFIDGNHDDHDQLAALARAQHETLGPQPVAPRIWWLPRGLRWRWHGRTWLALGGAVSPDRAGPHRIPGVSWWPQEAVTADQAHTIAQAGPADVMVCHDAPAAVPIVYGPAPAWWDLADLARSDAHRDLLQRVVDDVQPVWLLHGHHHQCLPPRPVAMRHGTVMVTGLDMLRADMPAGRRGGDYGVLDITTMRWQT